MVLLSYKILIKLFIDIIFIGFVLSTLSKSDRKSDNVDVDIPQTQEESGDKDEILKEYGKLDVGERIFQGQITLGYVTAWNNHGYDVAKWAAKKFTHISPVWFQLKRAKVDGQLSCKVEGTHDIDIGWLRDVRKNNSDVKMVPRFLFDGWQGNELEEFLTQEGAQQRCVRAMLDLMTRTQMDGAVVEIWLQIMAVTRGSAIEFLLELMEFWSAEFRKAGLQFILPLSPPLNANLQETGIVKKEHIRRLLHAVDYLNVMTYDYPSAKVAGVSPIGWVEANVQYLLDSLDDERGKLSGKLLMGLNFYGYDRTSGGNEAVLGKRFIELLTLPGSVLEFDEEQGEHRLSFGQNGIVYYPSIRSLKLRLERTLKMGIGGVAIWDLGQGLDHFTSLL